MDFDKWITSYLTDKGLIGVVEYDDNKDIFYLRQPQIDIDLYDPFWSQFENKKVKIKIEIIGD